MDFLLSRYWQPVKFRQGQNEHADIHDNVEGGAHPALEVDVAACSRICTIPISPSTVNRPALPNCDDLKSNQIPNVERDQRIDTIFKPWSRENAEEKQKDGNFDCGKTRKVDQFIPEKDLKSS